MKEKTIDQVLSDYNLSEEELKTILKSSKGKPKNANETKIDSGTKKFYYCYFSDPHIGSKEFREPLYNKMVKMINQYKPDFVLNAGDTLEGMSNRAGHIYELNQVGFFAQSKYAVELLSQINKPIYAIDGNHDGWYQKAGNAGIIVGEDLERRVKNYNFLGQMEGDLNVDGIKIKLFHGNDGSAYAMCFDNKTEILTNTGWKLFKDLLKEDKVATLDIKTDTFEWQKPTSYTDEEYNGELLHFTSRNIDLMVTPNHRMLVRRYPVNIQQSHVKELKYPTKSHKRIDFKWQFITADRLRNAKRQEWQLKRFSKNWKGSLVHEIKIPYLIPKNKGMEKRMKHIGSINIEEIAELIAWYVTEGYIRKTLISICQDKKVNPENHKNIISLFKKIGLYPTESGRNNKDINVYSLELAKWLVKECGSGSRNKHLPQWLKNQPQNILKIVFDTMIKGDGWINNKGFGYKTISKKLQDDFSEIAIKLGYAVTINKNTVSISNIQKMPTINKKPKSIQYNGKIYCVSVPNTTILVRRNGKVCWSGNSYKLQKLIESFTGGEKPNIVHSGHYHKSLYLFSRNVHGLESGTLQGQTSYMRGKKLQAHIGFGFVRVWHDGNGEIKRFNHEFVPYYN